MLFHTNLSNIIIITTKTPPRPMAQEKYDVFISYSRKDFDKVVSVKQ